MTSGTDCKMLISFDGLINWERKLKMFSQKKGNKFGWIPEMSPDEYYLFCLNCCDQFSQQIKMFM